MTPTRTPPPVADLPSVPETYLKDDLAESLARYAARLPEAPALLAALRDGVPGAPPRVTVRGLTGSARGFLVSWLQRETSRTLLYVVPHGEAFDEARDDLEYFRGPGE